MHDASLVALWFFLVIGTVIFADGALRLVNRRVAMFWLRRRMRWRRWGWAEVATGLGHAARYRAGCPGQRWLARTAVAGLAAVETAAPAGPKVPSSSVGRGGPPHAA